MATNFRRPPRYSPYLQGYIDRLRSQYSDLPAPREINPYIPPPDTPADEPGAFEKAMAQIGHVLSIPGVPFRALAEDQYQKHMMAQSGWTPEMGEAARPQLPELTTGQMLKAAAFDVGRPPATHLEAFGRGAAEMVGDIATDPVAMTLIGGGMGALPAGALRTGMHYGLMGMLGYGIVEGGKETYQEYQKQGAWTPEVTEKAARPVLDAALLLSPYVWRKIRPKAPQGRLVIRPDMPPGLPEGRVPPRLPAWAEGVPRRPGEVLDFDFVGPNAGVEPIRAAYDSPTARRMGRYETLAMRERMKGSEAGRDVEEALDNYGSMMEKSGWPDPVSELGGRDGILQLVREGRITQSEGQNLLAAMDNLTSATIRLQALAERGATADARPLLNQAAAAEIHLMRYANRFGSKAHLGQTSKTPSGESAQKTLAETIRALEGEREAALQAGDTAAAEALNIRIQALQRNYLLGERIATGPPETVRQALERLWREIEGAESVGHEELAQALRFRYEQLERALGEGRGEEVAAQDLATPVEPVPPVTGETFRMGGPETAQQRASRLWNEIQRAETIGDQDLLYQLRGQYEALEAAIARGQGDMPADAILARGEAPGPPPTPPETPPTPTEPPPSPPTVPPAPPSAPPTPTEPAPTPAKPGKRPPVKVAEPEPELSPEQKAKLEELLRGVEERGGPEARTKAAELATTQAREIVQARLLEPAEGMPVLARIKERWTQAEADAFDVYGMSTTQMQRLRREVEERPETFIPVERPEPPTEPPTVGLEEPPFPIAGRASSKAAEAVPGAFLMSDETKVSLGRGPDGDGWVIMAHGPRGDRPIEGIEWVGDKIGEREPRSIGPRVFGTKEEARSSFEALKNLARVNRQQIHATNLQPWEQVIAAGGPDAPEFLGPSKYMRFDLDVADEMARAGRASGLVRAVAAAHAMGKEVHPGWYDHYPWLADIEKTGKRPVMTAKRLQAPTQLAPAEREYTEAETEAAQQSFTPLGRGTWQVHPGTVGEPVSGLDGMVTKLQYAPETGTPRTIYTRETDLRLGDFGVSAGERQGMKAGREPSPEDMALEMLVPAVEQGGTEWGRIAEAVTAADPLHRPVLKPKRGFTMEWAEGQLDADMMPPAAPPTDVAPPPQEQTFRARMQDTSGKRVTVEITAMSPEDARQKLKTQYPTREIVWVKSMAEAPREPIEYQEGPGVRGGQQVTLPSGKVGVVRSVRTTMDGKHEAVVVIPGEPDKMFPVAELEALPGPRIYTSGLSRTKDFLAALSWEAPVGVDVGELSRDGVIQLGTAIARFRGHAFVDSGAFGVFRRNMKIEGVEALDFDKVFDRYWQIAEAAATEAGDYERDYHPPVKYVMPDVVGDQDASIEVLQKYGSQVHDMVLYGYAEPVIPIQKGERTLAEQLRASIEAAFPPGVGLEAFTVGLPGNAKAVTVDEVREFVAKVAPRAPDGKLKLHFLGVGPSARLAELSAAVLAEAPNAIITSDANVLRSFLRGDISRAEAMALGLGLPEGADVTPPPPLPAGMGEPGPTPDAILEMDAEQREGYLEWVDETLEDNPEIVSPQQLSEFAEEAGFLIPADEAAWHLRRWKKAKETPVAPEDTPPEPEPEPEYPDLGPAVNEAMTGDQRVAFARALERVPEGMRPEVTAVMLRQVKGQTRRIHLINAIEGTKNVPVKRRSAAEKKAYTANRAELKALAGMDLTQKKLAPESLLAAGYESLKGALADAPEAGKIVKRLQQIVEKKAIGPREKARQVVTPLVSNIAQSISRASELDGYEIEERIAEWAKEVEVADADVYEQLERDLEGWEALEDKQLKSRFLDVEGYGPKRIRDILERGPDHPDFPKVVDFRRQLAREMGAVQEFMLDDPEAFEEFIGAGARERYRAELEPVADALAADLNESPEPQGSRPFLSGPREGEYPDGQDAHLVKTFMWGIKVPGTRNESITTQEAIDAIRQGGGRIFARIARAYEDAMSMEREVETDPDVPFDVTEDPGPDDVMEAMGIWEQSMKDRPNQGRYGPAPRRPTKKQNDLFGRGVGPVGPIRRPADETRRRSDAERDEPTAPRPAPDERRGRPGAREPGGPGARRTTEAVEGARPRRGVFGVVLARAEETAASPPKFELVPEEHRKLLGEHQHVAVAKAIEQMEKRKGFLLADGTGVGKTHTIFSTAHHFAKKGHPVLIIAPTKTISPRKIDGRWTPTGSYAEAADQLRVRYTFAPSSMRDFPLNPANIYITTYHRLEDLQVTPETVVIFDEAHKLKNLEKSAVAPAGKAIGDKAHSVLFATATPGDTADQFLWAERVGILEGKTPAEQMHDLGMIVTEKEVYDTKTGQKVKKFYWRPLSEGKTNRRIQELFGRLTAQGAVLKREIDMSAVSVEVREVPLPEEGHMVMNLIEEKFPGGGLKAAVKLGHQRRQQEPYKLAETQRIITEELAQGRNVVVFAARINRSDVKKKVYGPDGEVVDEELIWTSEGTIKQLQEWLGEQDIEFSAIHGEASERTDDAISRFQSNDARVVVATVEKGGEGINLDDRTGDRPRTMVMMTAPFSSVEMFQAAGRIHRYTTVSPSKIIMLRSDNRIDKWNFDINASKMANLGARVSGQVDLLRPDLLFEFGGEGMTEALPDAEFPTAEVEAALLDLTNWRPSRDIKSVRQRNFFIKRLASLHPKWNEDGELFTIRSLEGDVFYGYLREGSYKIDKERPTTWGKIGFKKVLAAQVTQKAQQIGLFGAEMEPTEEAEAMRLAPGLPESMKLELKNVEIKPSELRWVKDSPYNVSDNPPAAAFVGAFREIMGLGFSYESLTDAMASKRIGQKRRDDMLEERAGVVQQAVSISMEVESNFVNGEELLQKAIKNSPEMFSEPFLEAYREARGEAPVRARRLRNAAGQAFIDGWDDAVQATPIITEGNLPGDMFSKEQTAARERAEQGDTPGKPLPKQKGLFGQEQSIRGVRPLLSRQGKPGNGGHDSSDAEVEAAFDKLFATIRKLEKVKPIELPGANWLRPIRAGKGVPALEYRMIGGAKVLHTALAERLVNFKPVNWRTGEYVARTPADLGAVYMVARNPNFEQASFMLKDVETGRIVYGGMISSGVPVAVAWADDPVKWKLTLWEAIAKAEKINGGRRVKLVTGHNHPSGNSEPSVQDLKFDQELRDEFGETYEGGVVINHEEFSTITYEGNVQKVTPYRRSLAGITEPDPFLREGIDATAFYRSERHSFNLMNPAPEMRALRTFFRPETLGDDWPMLVMLDATRHVRDVMVVPPMLWQDVELFRGYVKEWGKASGAVFAIAAIDNPTFTDRLLAEEYMKDGTLGDAVNITPVGQSSVLIDAMMKGKANLIMVGGQQIPYDIETGNWREAEDRRKFPPPMRPSAAGGAGGAGAPPSGPPAPPKGPFNWPGEFGPGPGEGGWERRVRFAEKRQAARARGAAPAAGVDPTTFWDMFIIGADRFTKGFRDLNRWLSSMTGPSDILRRIWKGLMRMLRPSVRVTERRADPGAAETVFERGVPPRRVRPIAEPTRKDLEDFIRSVERGEPVDPGTGQPPVAGRGGIPGLDININRVHNEAGIHETITRLVRALEAKFGRARSFRSWEKAKELAIKMGLTEADVKRLLEEKGVLTDYEIIAARIMRQEAGIDFAQKHAEYRDLAERLKNETDPVRKASLEAAVLEAQRDSNAAAAKLMGISMTTVAAGSEAGRALNIHRMMAQSLTPEEFLLRKLIRQKVASEDDLAKLAQALQDHDMARVNDILRKVYKPTLLDKILEYWINSILSGPPTHAANITGNTTMQAIQVPERGLAAKLEQLGVRQALEKMLTGEVSPRERVPGEATEMFKALITTRFGFTQALKLSWDALWNPNKYAIGAKGEYRPPAIKGPLGNLIRAPSRLMEGADLGAKSSAANAELHARSWRRAINEMQQAGQKWTRDELHKRVDDIRDIVRRYAEIEGRRRMDPEGVTKDERRFLAEHRWAAEDVTAMEKFADQMTFRDENAQLTKYWMLIRNRYPWLTFMTPFIRTPERILVQAVRRTPVGLARTIQNIKAGRLKGGEASDRLAQGILGTLMSAGIYMAAKDGMITGAGPSDPRKRRAWLETGKRPYAVKVGDTWVSFARIEPLATTFGFAADLAEAQDDKVAGDIFDKLHYSVVQNIANKTYLEGMISTAEALGDPDRYGARLYKRMVGALVPNLFATAARAIDPTFRQTDSIQDTLLARVPWFSMTVPARLTGTGEFAERGEDPISRFISPFRYAREAGPEKNLERMFLETGYSPSAPPRYMTLPGTMGRKVMLTQQERALYAAYARRATAFARELTKNGDWNRLDVYMKAEFLRRVYRFAHDAGRRAMYRSVLARIRRGEYELKGF